MAREQSALGLQGKIPWRSTHLNEEKLFTGVSFLMANWPSARRSVFSAEDLGLDNLALDDLARP